MAIDGSLTLQSDSGHNRRQDLLWGQLRVFSTLGPKSDYPYRCEDHQV